jgi:hypothetical protein
MIDSTTGLEAATRESDERRTQLFMLAKIHCQEINRILKVDSAHCVLEMIFNCCLLQSRSLKQLHEVPLGLMRRTDFIEIVCELVFPLKPNHQLAHLSQETDCLPVCFVVLLVQCGLDGVGRSATHLQDVPYRA